MTLPRQNDRRGTRRLLLVGISPCLLYLPDGPVEGRIHNISSTGVGMLGPSPVPVGESFPVLLINAAHTYALMAEVRVARCALITGEYFLGTFFTPPLRHDDLTPLLVHAR